MDEIFGAERLLNEIIWVYHGPSPIRSAFNRKHDTILAYSKSPDYIFNVDAVREPYNPNTIKTFASSSKAGFGKIPDLDRGKVPEDWWYFPVVARLHNERTGYPTQKPQALMERIILASSNPGDIVADFFCGAGTTSFVAAQLGRRFLVSDIATRAIHTTRSRHVSGSDQAFSLKIDSNLKVKRKVGQPGRIRVSDQKVKIDPVLCDDLDFWEVDPDWDGQIFRSARQAVRPWNKGAISNELLLPIPNEGQSIAVRLVKINGEQIQIVIPG